ncbi:transposase [Bacillus sp. FJAT-45037]|uniref:transposase n=1 Tax=Bacillus sp. FJAT-45037 TaxID=2011007 RepID=UPI000C235722|nr:transposase [Bacillus sp. FJAT-45037]
MNVLIGAGIVLVPIFMVVIDRFWSVSRLTFHSLAFGSLIVFGYISATAIYAILRDHEVFMTSIHGIFLEPLFLISGAYIGWYALFVVLRHTIIAYEAWKKSN